MIVLFSEPSENTSNHNSTSNTSDHFSIRNQYTTIIADKVSKTKSYTEFRAATNDGSLSSNGKSLY